MTRKELIEKLLELGDDDTPVAIDNGWEYFKPADPWMEHYIRVLGSEAEPKRAQDCIVLSAQ